MFCDQRRWENIQRKFIIFFFLFKCNSSLKMILFIYLFLHCCARAVSGGYSVLRARASRCGGLSCCRAWASGAMPPGLWSMGSAVVVQELNCSEVCGIFPDWGRSPHWKAYSLPLSHQGSPLSRVSLLQGSSGPLTCVALQEGDSSHSLSKAF